MAEHDAPRNRLILALVIGTVSSLVVVVLAIAQFFDVTVREEIFRKELSKKPIQRREQEAKEERMLNAYQWVNSKQGVVRIPVAKAKELVLKEWDSRPTGLSPGADVVPPPPPAPAKPAAPAPGTAPAPAPATAPATPAPAPAPGTPAPPPPAPGGATPK